MPRKTKEQVEKEKLEKEEVKKKTTTKKAATKKATTKKATAKKTTAKKADDKDAVKASAKKTSTTKKASSTTKKTTTKKSTAKKADDKDEVKATTKKASTTKKTSTKKSPSTSKKATAKKSTTKKVATKKAMAKVQAIPAVEYYDLPYRYNQTVVKLLAQTPTTLFVYWDISDADRENYVKTFGEHFFEETKPVLIIKNTTMNYSFEVDINDFANSWYLHVNDSKCDYSIELGRRPVSVETRDKINTDYIYISSSNVIESPNDRILFNIDAQRVYYRNVKNNVSSTRSISLIKSMGNIYNIYELYKSLYKDEDFIDNTGKLPTSSTSSWFK